jgi:hypothetical protein
MVQKTNREIVEEINNVLPAMLDRYFENVNSMVFATDKVGPLYKVPSIWVEKVNINFLPLDKDTAAHQIELSELTEKVRDMLPICPFVRVKIPIEDILEAYKSTTHLSALLDGIVNSVQRQWEQKFGSYKNNRWGTKFFQYKPLILFNDLDDLVHFDFYGDWASNEEAQ